MQTWQRNSLKLCPAENYNPRHTHPSIYISKFKNKLTHIWVLFLGTHIHTSSLYGPHDGSPTHLLDPISDIRLIGRRGLIILRTTRGWGAITFVLHRQVHVAGVISVMSCLALLYAEEDKISYRQKKGYPAIPTKIIPGCRKVRSSYRWGEWWKWTENISPGQ